MSSFNFSLSNAKTSTEKSLRLTQASSFFTSGEDQLEHINAAYEKLRAALEELEKAWELE